MLASVYSYCVMVKSISSCCVRGRRVLSNPVTIIQVSQVQVDLIGIIVTLQNHYRLVLLVQSSVQ